MVAVPPPQRGSHIQLGDFVARAGIYTNPGVVIEKKADGDVVVDTEPAAIQQYHRHSISNGLTIEEKDRFNGIMDEVMSITANGDRINALQAVLDDLKHDPASKKVVGSLKNEQSQLIRMSRELPRVYGVEIDKIR